MIEHTTTFVLTSTILAVMTAVFLLWTRRLEDGSRRLGYAVVAACGAMSVAYLLMAAGVLSVSTTGRDESIARFLGYSVAWGAVCYVIGMIADAERRYTLLLLGGILLSLWATVGSWILGGAAGTVLTLAIVAGVSVMGGVLYGPLAREAQTVSSERTLLYGRLKNLTMLVFVGLLTTGMLSAQNLGFTDAFIGQALATYLDFVWLAGFGGLVLRSRAALSDAGNERDATEATGSNAERVAVGTAQSAD
ncbi:homolog to rhodopsin [Natrialba magadii ATCC 43099]|uniref:Rhodopsin n=1 Tax=Natrialba magadii (strain ATCC 43099 / DSM 3394 / CCM 3739 / CIP 104546 / IAM 13178 / JCM 8861 / NBRC 102185 / NCIMB 2190 / MS3) TaxID=547559 RepID=D3T0F5_NATMM|nr:bacteriorhodopsin [Natrialba magadii]ADD06434.1 homolog to rhodopsin [Natrialba magadii ATCC 43099]ELY31679.1 rhodopsin [Natrialba magadii ATCC 43099]